MTRAAKILFPIIILAIGLGAYQLLASMREPPQKADRSYLGPLVEAIAVPAQKVQVTVEGQGTVHPDAQIDLGPQVSGVVIWKADDFEPGGSFAEGDLLFQIEPRDYQLAADQADADGSAWGYPQVSAESLLDADPDLIFLADTRCCAQDAETVAARPGWESLTAVKTGRIVELDDDVASRWGPRIVDFLRAIVNAVNAID